MISLLAILLALVPSSSSAENPAHYARQFETRYRSAVTLEATFLEKYSENGQLVRMEAGTVYFRRPGKMRWEYKSPEKNLFLVDGKTAWFYVPEDHTVTRAPAKKSDDWRTPLALLAGEMKVSRICSRIEISATETPESSDDVMLYCELRGGKVGSSGSQEQKESRGDAVFFEIVSDSGELVRILVRQKGGLQMEFLFKNWQMDAPLPDSLFRFEVPRGVAIVNAEAPEQP